MCVVSTARAEISGGAAATLDTACRHRLSCIAAYADLRRAGTLKAFGSRESLAVLPPKPLPDAFRAITGLPTEAFAPKPQNPAGLRLAPLEAASALLVAQLCFASGVLVDDLPLRNLRELNAWELPTLALSVLLGSATVLFILDRLLLQERLLALLRLVVPSQREAVLRHEAGHFLCAYCLGVPVQACKLNPITSAFDPRFEEMAAGTCFLSPAIQSLQEGRPANEQDVLHAAVVLVGGIAAEALWVGNAEGGAADEAALRVLLTKHAAPGAITDEEIRECARWAAAAAVLLLRKHADAYEALCAAMRRAGNLCERREGQPVAVRLFAALRPSMPELLPARPRSNEYGAVQLELVHFWCTRGSP